MSNLNSVFDTLRGWPHGSALEASFKPDPTVTSIEEGVVVKTENRQLSPASVLNLVDDSLVAPPAPALGLSDRGKAYAVAGIGGLWSGFDIGDIVEWSGTAWVVIVAAVEGEEADGTRAVVTGGTAAGTLASHEEKVAVYAIKGVQTTLALGNIDLTNAKGVLELTLGLGNVDVVNSEFGSLELTLGLGNVDVVSSEFGVVTLELAVGGYVNCVADVGETVTAVGSGDTGIMVAFDNGTRVWTVAPTSATDTFADGDALTVGGGGSGVGDVIVGGVTVATNAYVDCVADDVGKAVAGSVSGHSGILIAYNNGTFTWSIAPDNAVTDTFLEADVLTITGGGGGGGIITGGGITAIANDYVNCDLAAIGGTVTATGSGDTGTLAAYDNGTRVWTVIPDTAAMVFAEADTLVIGGGGTGSGIVTGGGVGVATNVYVPCVGGDVGELVTGSVSGDTGTLIAYDNGTFTWSIAPTNAVADTFLESDVLTIGSGGIGVGVIVGGGITSIANPYVDANDAAIGSAVTATGSGHAGILVAYNNTTRVWLIEPDDNAVDVFAEADTLVVAAGLGSGIVTGGGVGVVEAYVNCVNGDIGELVTGSVSGDTGILIAFDNGTRVWSIAPTTLPEDFVGFGDRLTIGGGGSGIATVAAGGVAGIANPYVNADLTALGSLVTGTGSGDTGTLLAYNNATRVWTIDPELPADVFADGDTMAVAAGTGSGIITGAGVVLDAGGWSFTAPVDENRILIDGTDSVYEDQYFDYRGTHAAGAWGLAYQQIEAPAIVSKLTSGSLAGAPKDEAWLIIQGNDQWDAAYVNKVTCLKMRSGCTYKLQHDDADSLVAGSVVEANAGVLRAVTSLWPIGVVVWSNGTAGDGGQISVASY